jgi:AbrB family looped-hinge helix DNA binding protein
MPSNQSTISAKGQTTVPAHIRQAIGAAPGTRLVWHVLNDGRLFVRVLSNSENAPRTGWAEAAAAVAASGGDELLTGEFDNAEQQPRKEKL